LPVSIQFSNPKTNTDSGNISDKSSPRQNPFTSSPKRPLPAHGEVPRFKGGSNVQNTLKFSLRGSISPRNRSYSTALNPTTKKDSASKIIRNLKKWEDYVKEKDDLKSMVNEYKRMNGKSLEISVIEDYLVSLYHTKDPDLLNVLLSLNKIVKVENYKIKLFALYYDLPMTTSKIVNLMKINKEEITFNDQNELVKCIINYDASSNYENSSANLFQFERAIVFLLLKHYIYNNLDENERKEIRTIIAKFFLKISPGVKIHELIPEEQDLGLLNWIDTGKDSDDWYVSYDGKKMECCISGNKGFYNN